MPEEVPEHKCISPFPIELKWQETLVFRSVSQMLRDPIKRYFDIVFGRIERNYVLDKNATQLVASLMEALATELLQQLRQAKALACANV